MSLLQALYCCAEGLDQGFRVVINDGAQGCECTYLANVLSCSARCAISSTSTARVMIAKQLEAD